MSRWIGAALVMCLVISSELFAQVQPPAGPEAANYDEIKGLLDAIEARVQRMNQRSDAADQQLRFLNEQVDQAIGLLSSRREENEALRDKTIGLTDIRDDLQVSREELRDQLVRLTDERDGMLADLETRIADIGRQLQEEQRNGEDLRAGIEETRTAYATVLDERDGLAQRLQDAERAAAVEAEQTAARLLEIESLNRENETLREVRANLEGDFAAQTAAAAAAEKGLTDARLEAAALTEQLNTSKTEGEQLVAEVGALRVRRIELEARLTEQEERADVAQRELESRKDRVAELEAVLIEVREGAAEEDRAAEAAKEQIGLLNDRLGALKLQLAAVSVVLEASEAKNQEREAVIENLQARLNVALASKVQELARYRSEFFGRLREVLGERPDINIVGDRFVFQSEVLFATGEAEIGDDGQAQLDQLATTLAEIAETIPADVDWVLRVDGHTDTRPISTPAYPSNWELSTARATSVVKFLIDRGIGPSRLVPAGFGEFHPLEAGDDEIAYRRNRRIEFKLTQR